jgi:hypothetical protein
MPFEVSEVMTLSTISLELRPSLPAISRFTLSWMPG